MFNSKSLAIGAVALACAISSASANITFDLRAVGIDSAVGTIGANGKSVVLEGTAVGVVQLQVWGQVTNAAPTSTVFGIQAIVGSIRSSPAGTGSPIATGTMSTMTIGAPWNNLSQIGQLAELTTPPDQIIDLGSNITTSVSTNYIKYRKDPLAGGTQVGTVFFASNQDPNGATFQPITNGYEFLMGTATLTLQSFNPANFAAGRMDLNWVIPGFTTAANRGQIAQWTDGDGIVNNGSAQLAEMFVGSAINFTVIPEPSVAVTLLGGVATLLGLRRRKF
jgi:hypothetical protein